MSAIPFNRPFFAGNEQKYIAEAISRGQISGNGHFTRQCEGLLEELLPGTRVLLTTSCTDALEMSGLLMNLGPDDEVILPSFTFVSTVNAYALRGARPVFVDVRPDTLNLDERQLEARISDRTRAVVPVHYGGVGCEMNRIVELADAHGFLVVEDNAHGLFGSYRGQALGTFGQLSTLSFHETKNISCGEGGALCIRDDSLVERAEILREKGTNRAKFLRGQVDKYTWVDVGSSFLPSDLLAAFLFGQLEERDRIQSTRSHIWQRYATELADWAAARGVRLPTIPEECEQSYHLFYMILPNAQARDGLIAHLRADDILAVFHYQPLHDSPMGHRYGYGPGDCPVTEDLSRRLVRLPFYNDMTDDELDRVIAGVLTFDP